ncbi:hypothetical protein [Luteimonas sp. 3794]|uniref:hypothetical protein n=1 Tax=Luteimonas sp. 3794 TaxID=2817730 RepID=UPI002863C867|nr:hypothetical protein [Luteimonas sp. 3794]MDR6991627.1 hypothetical protein [Luteimonas sp. 3794]
MFAIWLRAGSNGFPAAEMYDDDAGVQIVEATFGRVSKEASGEMRDNVVVHADCEISQ